MALTDEDFQRAAERLGCEKEAIEAVARVERAGDDGFTTFQRKRVPDVLFERHVFYWRVTHHHTVALADELVRRAPGLCNTIAGGYKGGPSEHQRLSAAVTLLKMRAKPRDAALESASYGAFQVMGYHWEALGYESLQQFINKMWSSEEAHLDAFLRYIEHNGLATALRARQWAAFAHGYNGPSYKRYRYHRRMEKEYERLKAAETNA